jgi:hypothetical protein
MNHTIVEAIVENMTIFLTDPPDHNPFARHKGRTGSFHASDMNVYKKWSARHCVEIFLGLPTAKVFTPESAMSIAIGQAIDYATSAALDACGWAETQLCLENSALRFRGTPDFNWLGGYTPLVGDVKSTDEGTYRQYWANSDWDLSRAYYWRQLQSYLYLAEQERGLLVAVNRNGANWQHDLRACISARYYYRDEKCIAKLLADLRYLGECADRYLAATTDLEREAALPRL